MLGPFQASTLPGTERVAFVGALSAIAACDGAATIDETLAVLSRFDLDDLPVEDVRSASAHVLDPPPLADALAPLRALGDRQRTGVLAELLLVAQVDGDLVPAEIEALAKAQAMLGLTPGQRRTAERRARRALRDRALDGADWVDNLRNAAVLLAGFGVPVMAIARAGGAAEGLLVLPAGVEALGMGYGAVAGVGVVMVLSVASSALVGFATARGQRAERLQRELVRRHARERANLKAVVDTLEERVHTLQFGTGLKTGLVALEERMQLYLRTLRRLEEGR